MAKRRELAQNGEKLRSFQKRRWEKETRKTLAVRDSLSIEYGLDPKLRKRPEKWRLDNTAKNNTYESDDGGSYGTLLKPL